MSDKSHPVYYWDSTEFIYLIEKRPDVFPTLRILAEQAEKKLLTIVTSTFTIAEVAITESEKEIGLSKEAEDQIDKLWHPSSPFRLVEFHRGIAEKAREIIRRCAEEGWTRPKGKDAVHLATAAVICVDEFHTHDRKLIKLNGRFGFPICKAREDLGDLFNPTIET